MLTQTLRYATPAVLAASVLFVLSAPVPTAHAGTDSDTPASNYTIKLGLHGYSPVSYFTHNEARPGSPKHTASYNGVTYFFESAEQVETFNADPERFVPAYGGYCAFGASKRKHFVINPEAFKIVEGRLFVFKANEQVNARDKWNAGNETELTQMADAFWHETHGN